MRTIGCTLIKTCAIVILASGCSGAVKYPHYYTLSLAPETKAAEGATGEPITIAVQRFYTPTYIRQGRIAFRESPEAVGFYEYHRWAADPGGSVTGAMIEGLRSGNRIAVEEPAYSNERSDYVLSGGIKRLEEIDFDGGVKVEATLFAELRDGRTGVPVWSGQATQRESVDRHDIGEVVKQMNVALQSSVDQLLEEVERHVAPREQARH
jgi:uncharacterized lipoprotein YmbA